MSKVKSKSGPDLMIKPNSACKTCVHCKTYPDHPRFAICQKSKMPFHIEAKSNCIYFEAKADNNKPTELLNQQTLF
jgi:hypothetical protein